MEFMYFVLTWAGGTVLWIQAFAVCWQYSPLAYALQNQKQNKVYLWWSLCTLYLPGQVGQFFGFRHLLFADSIHLLLMPCKIRNRLRCTLVEFMYHVFTWAGGTVLCIQVFAVCSEHSPLACALRNLKQNKDVPVVEFMYLVFTWAGGTYSSLNSGICCLPTGFTSCLAKLETE